MSVNIRFPNITASTEKEQIAQIKSYLHQLVEQLNYALPTLGSGDGSVQAVASNIYSVQGGELSYYELRSLIIQEINEIDNLFENLSEKMKAEYIKNEELQEAIDQALAQAKESGEFDGPQGEKGEQGIQGIQGEQGPQGIQGEPGISVTHEWSGTVLTVTSASGTSSADLKPKKGVDYFTEEEVNSVAAQAAGRISFTMDEDGNLYYEVEE